MDQVRSINEGVGILLVGDRSESLLALRASLENEPYDLVVAASGPEALLQILQRDFAAIVLDVQMPDMDGFEVVELIRGRERSQHTPIIYLTAAYQSDADALRAYRLGAADYIVKPVIPEVLRSKVAAFVVLNRLQRELQEQLAETWRLNQALEQTNLALGQSEAKLLDLNASLERRVLERTAALREAEQKLRFLTEAGGQLAASLDQAETVQTILHLVVPRLADWCILELVQEDGSLRRAAALHVDPEKTKLLTRFDNLFLTSAAALAGLPSVVSLSESEFYAELISNAGEKIGRDAKLAELRHEIGMESGIIAPLTARGRTLGALVAFTSDSGRNYSPSDLVLVQEFARRAALALDNCRLYDDSLAAVRARDHFLAVASHELKTPLTVIGGYADLLKRNVETSLRSAENDNSRPQTLLDNEKLLRQATNIQEASAKLRSLVNDLLDINRLQTRSLELGPERFDLVNLVRQVIQNFIARDQSQHRSTTINYNCKQEEIWGWWDRGRIEQVIVNLIDNAIKYSVGSGPVDVELDVQDGGDGSRQVHLMVRDYGIGIPPADQAKVFDPFTRASNALEQHFPGLGLGLAITQRILEGHRGSIAVSSAGLNQGATFRVTLPLVAGGEAEADLAMPRDHEEITDQAAFAPKPRP